MIALTQFLFGKILNYDVLTPECPVLNDLLLKGKN